MMFFIIKTSSIKFYNSRAHEAILDITDDKTLVN